jgi:hypothetical protein
LAVLLSPFPYLILTHSPLVRYLRMRSLYLFQHTFLSKMKGSLTRSPVCLSILLFVCSPLITFEPAG